MTRDPILGGLVAATAVSTPLELPVVLLSGGTLIEGRLVSEARWLDELATILEAGSTAAVALGGVFRAARASIEMAAAVGDTGSDLVHLVDAVVRAGGSVQAVGLWRVSLDAVDGWKLGAALPQSLRAVEG